MDRYLDGMSRALLIVGYAVKKMKKQRRVAPTQASIGVFDDLRARPVNQRHDIALQVIQIPVSQHCYLLLGCLSSHLFRKH